MADSKALNTSGGKNTFRFAGAAARQSAAEGHIARRVRTDLDAQATPDHGQHASFFSQELERLRELDLTDVFKRLAYQLVPLSKTLAQLVHHRQQIVELLLGATRSFPVASLRSPLQLWHVLARDLRAELLPDLSAIVETMQERIDPQQPEVTAEVFRGCAFMYKYLGQFVVCDARFAAHINAWMRFLGSKTPYIHDMSASAIALLLRKLGRTKLIRQLSLILGGMSRVPAGVRASDVGTPADLVSALAASARSPDLKDGVATLVFECLRTGRVGLHSDARGVFQALLGTCAPPPPAAAPATASAAATGGPAAPARGAAETHKGGKRKRDASSSSSSAASPLRGPPAPPSPPPEGAAFSHVLRFELLAQTVRLARERLDAASVGALWHVIADAVPSAVTGLLEATRSQSAQAAEPHVLWVSQLAGLLRMGLTDAALREGGVRRRHVCDALDSLSVRHLWRRGTWKDARAPMLLYEAFAALLLHAWPRVMADTGAGGGGRGGRGARGGGAPGGRKGDYSRGAESSFGRGVHGGGGGDEEEGGAAAGEEDIDPEECSRRASRWLALLFTAEGGVPGGAPEKAAAPRLGCDADALVLAVAAETIDLAPEAVRALGTPAGARRRPRSAVEVASQFARQLIAWCAGHAGATAARTLALLLPALGGFLSALATEGGGSRGAPAWRAPTPAAGASGGASGAELAWALVLEAHAATTAGAGDGAMRAALRDCKVVSVDSRLLLSAPGAADEEGGAAGAGAGSDLWPVLLQQLAGCSAALVQAAGAPAASRTSRPPAAAAPPALLPALWSVHRLASCCSALVVPADPLAAALADALEAVARVENAEPPVSQAERRAAHHAHARIVSASVSALPWGPLPERAQALLRGPSETLLWLLRVLRSARPCLGFGAVGRDEAAAGEGATELSALALVALHAAASLLESAAAAEAAAGGSSSSSSSGGAAVPASLAAATKLELSDWVSHPDHAVRLCALRVAASLPPEDWLRPGQAVDCTVSADASGPARTQVLLDESLAVDADSTFEGPCRLLEQCLLVEALPSTLLFERARVNALIKLGAALPSRAAPPLDVLVLMRHVLGLLHVPFAPIWPAAGKTFAVAAAAYPKTAWAVFGHQLRAVSLCLIPSVVTSEPAEAHEPAPADATHSAHRAPHAMSRSQARSFQQASRLTSLRRAHEALRDAAAPPAHDPADPLLPLRSEGALLGSSLHEYSSPVLQKGLTGAATALPRRVLAIISGANPATGGSSGGFSTHVNDRWPLQLGAGGATDVEVIHRHLLEVLQAQPTFAEARSKALVPLFLCFVKDAFLAPTNSGEGTPECDVDSVELALPECLEGLLSRHHASQAAALAAQQRKSLKAGTTSVRPATSASQAAVLWHSLERVDALLEQLALTPAAAQTQSSAPRAPAMTRHAAAARLLSFLGMFRTFRNWDGVFGRTAIASVMLRLVARAEGGVGEAALRVLLAMKPPAIVPYGDNLLRMYKDDSLRDEMATFAVSAAPQGTDVDASTVSIAKEHRAPLISVVVRVLFGRLLQRSSRSGRDSPASRRAAIMGYLSGLLPAELGVVVYQALRPLLLAFVAGVPDTGLPLLRGEEPAAVLTLIPRPSSTEECGRLVDAFAASLHPPPSRATVNPLLGLLSGSRAVGVLTLLHDLVRQMGRSLVPHLHVVLATVILLLRETQVGSDSESAAAGPLGSRGAEVRGLALLRLQDIMAAHHDSYDFSAWLPLVRQALLSALPMLPGAMAHASKPSALLSLLALWATKPALRYFLHGIPCAIPAALACLSAGLPGASKVFLQHMAASAEGASDIEVVDPARASESAGPSSPVLAAAFAIAASLVGLGPDGSIDNTCLSTTTLQLHVPVLLQHLAVRLESASYSTPSPPDASKEEGAQLKDVFAPRLRVPSLKAGSRAFARQQLAVLARVAEVLQSSAAPAADALPANDASGSVPTTVAWRLTLLLLPYLRARTAKQRAAVARDTREAAAGGAAAEHADQQLLVLRILRMLVTHLEDPARVLPFLAHLLAPGPRAVEGVTRQALVDVLAASTLHPALVSAAPGMKLLQRLARMNPKRVGELDYDVVLDAVSEATGHGSSGSVGAWLRVSQDEVSAHSVVIAPTLAAAVLHQLLYLMHDTDMALRQSAGNALSSIVRDAATVALSWAREYSTAVLPSEATPLCDVSTLLPLLALHSIVIPDVHASLSTANPTTRRGFVVLLSDIVSGLLPLAEMPPAVLTALETQLGIAPRHLHLDLGTLINASDAEADIFTNLTHVQVHRRARALLRLSSLVAEDLFSEHSVLKFILPITLHSIYDEGGNTAQIVESKGRSHKVRGGAAASAYAGGLHSEAVKLLGAVAKVLPWPQFLSTLRLLLRQIEAEPALEKVLVRAVLAVVEAFHFDTTLELDSGSQPAPSRNGLRLALSGHEFQRMLSMALDAKGVGASRMRATALAVTPASDAVAGDARFVGSAIDQSATANYVESTDCEPRVVKKSDIANHTSEPLDCDEDLGAEDDDADKLDMNHHIGRSLPSKPSAEVEDEKRPDDDDDDDDAQSSVELPKDDGDGDKNVDDASVQDGDSDDDEVGAHLDTQVEHLSSEAEVELRRRDILLSISTVIIPALRRLVFKSGTRSTKKPGIAGSSKSARDNGSEMRVPLVIAWLRMLQLMPLTLFRSHVHGVLATVTRQLRSRAQDQRDTAKGALSKMSALLGPAHLRTILESLRSSLTEGYQVHVLGHALHAVVTALVPQLEAAAAAAAATAGAAPPTAASDKSAAVPVAEKTVDGIEPPPLPDALANLVDALPTIVDLILDDVLGEAAEARDVESGYNPSHSLVEAKRCRSHETLEAVMRCIPFLPYPTIHAVTAPLAVALSSEARSGKALDGLTRLFVSIQTGLRHNPSVDGRWLLVYVHGLCVEFLHLSAADAVKSLSHDDTLTQASTSEVSALNAAASAALAVGGYTDQLGAAAASVDVMLPSRHAGKLQGVAVKSWIVRGGSSLENSVASSSVSGSSPVASVYVPLSGAHRQKGAGPAMVRDDPNVVLPEPRMTRYTYASSMGKTARQFSNSGASSAADSPMSVFALTLFRNALQDGLVMPRRPAHFAMLDPYVPLFLRLLQTSKDVRIVALALRLLTDLITSAPQLPALRSFSTRLVRAILASVENSAGGSISSAAVANSPRAELAMASIKAITALIKSPAQFKINEEQLKALLIVIRADLHLAVRHNATFGLLKAIIGRRLLVSEVYDLMDDVAKIMVTSLKPTARALCASALLAFLLRYPMTDKKLQAHMQFFVVNLGYAQEDGRIAVLEMLTAVVSKFPESVLDEYAGPLLLPLVARLSAEPSKECRAAIAAVIRQLVTRVGKRAALEMAATLPLWLAREQAACLRQCAAQLTGIIAAARMDALVDVLPQVMVCLTAECKRANAEHRALEAQLQDRLDAAVLPVAGSEEAEAGVTHAALAAIARAADISSGRLPDDKPTADSRMGSTTSKLASDDHDIEQDEEEARVPPQMPVGTAGGGSDVFERTEGIAYSKASKPTVAQGPDLTSSLQLAWESAYHALVAMEKLWTADPVHVEDTLLRAGCESLPESVCDLLLYPHAWVRLAATRWFDRFLSRHSDSALKGAAAPKGVAVAALDMWLCNPQLCFRVARLLATQLSSPNLGTTLADHSVRCLEHFTVQLHALTPATREVESFSDTLVASPFPIDDGAVSADSAGSDAEAVGEASRRIRAKVALSSPPGTPSRLSDPLLRIFDRMASIGTTGSPVAVTAVIKWISTVTLRLPAAEWRRYLPAVVRLLFRIATLGDAEATTYASSIRALAQETSEVVQAHVGADVFVQLLNAERNRVAAARIARRQERAVERVLDPQAAAQAKAKRQAAKLRQKQRKIDDFRMSKGKASTRRQRGSEVDASDERHGPALGKRRREAKLE